MRAICSLSLLEAAAKLLLVAAFDRMFCIAGTSDGLTAAIPSSILATLLCLVMASAARANAAQQAFEPVACKQRGKMLSFVQRNCSVASLACAMGFSTSPGPSKGFLSMVIAPLPSWARFELLIQSQLWVAAAACLMTPKSLRLSSGQTRPLRGHS